MKVVVAVVQVVAVLCAAAFVVLLFVNEPERIDPQAAAEEPSGEAVAIDAAALFTDRCAGCHGPDGGGGRGPQLSDGRVAAAYPDIEDQIAVVTGGRGGMPSFADRLTADEIRAVVAFSRTL